MFIVTEYAALSLIDFHDLISKGTPMFKLEMLGVFLSQFSFKGHTKANSEDPDHIMSSLIWFCTVCQCHIK